MTTANNENTEFLHVSIDLWHPGCWTTQVTEETNAGILCYSGTMNTGTKCKCTIYGDSDEHVTQAIETARDSSLVRIVKVLERKPPCEPASSPIPGTSIRDIVVEYDAATYAGPALLSHGFILAEPSRMENGTETWPLLIETNRTSVERKLDSIGEKRDVEVALRRLSPVDHSHASPPVKERFSALPLRQREALALARKRGYYSWPREITVRELAAEFGVSKTTFLEYLRTAEAALLDSFPESS